METYDYSIMCRNAHSETESIECQIKGILPTWLHGFALYNGPGLTQVGDTEYKHAFDSSALLQKFVIRDGKILYSSKFVESETFKKNKKAGSIVMPEFGTPGPQSKGVMSRLKNAFDSDTMMSDNAPLTVVKIATKFYALGETPYFLEVDPNTLHVVQRINLNRSHNLATQSVHLVKDEEGFYYTIGQLITISGPKYAIMKFPQDGNVEKGKVVATLPCHWRLSPSYIHSMAFTKRHCIVLEPPLAVSIMDLIGDVLSNKPFISGLHWKKNEPVIFHVLDRSTWKPVATRYVSDPFFFLHFNAYEDVDEHLVVDVCAYKDSSILHNMFIHKLKEGKESANDDYHSTFCATLKRFILPLRVSAKDNNAKDMSANEQLITLQNTQCCAVKHGSKVLLTSEDMFDQPFENPSRNPKWGTDGSHYVWGVSVPKCSQDNFSPMIKVDLKTKTGLIFKEERLYPGPAIFVPAPDGQNEDDGVLLCPALSGADEQLVTLLIIDAANMTEICRATTHASAPVPTPLHGNFYEESM